MKRILQTISFLGLVGLAGCGDSDINKGVSLGFYSGNGEQSGIVFMDHNNRNVYYDYGFDGTLDKALVFKTDSNGKLVRTEMTASSPEFAQYVPEYLKVREKATNPENRSKP